MICWPSTVSAYSSTTDIGRVADLTESITTGDSLGLFLLKLGGVVISIGSRRCATVKAVCTSSAAPSMLRSSTNWVTILLRPSVDVDVSELMPEIVDNWRSIGAATEDAMVSALAPGNWALIVMVG